MDIDKPRTRRLADMRSRGPHKHWCKVCTKNFPSGKALGGHMSCHRHAGMQPRSTPSPPANVVNVPVSLLGLCDEKPSLPSLETQCLNCSKEFSTFQSLRGNMRMHTEEKVIAMSDEEPAGLMESSANANGDHGHNVMLFSPVKRKRSKRGLPALDSEMRAASALLMLAEYSDKSSGYKDCHGGGDSDNISTPNLLKEVNLNAFDQLVQSDEFTNNTRPESYKISAYEGLYELSQKENRLNLAADVPRKMALLNVFDHGLVDGDSEFMKPEADISFQEMKSGNLSVAVNIKRYKCQVCGKLFGSEHALGFHMRLHCEKENRLNLVADAPKKEVLLNVFDHGLDVDAEFMKPGADNSVEDLKSGDLSAAVHIKSYQCKVYGKLLRSGRALGGHMTSHLHRGKENTLNLVADVPKTEVLLNVFDHGLDVDAEFMKPGADISVEELKFNDLSAAVNVKRYQCNVCGKLLRSGRALRGHMTSHLHREQENTMNLVANVPKMEVLLNVFDHGLDVDAEFMKPGADISVEELKFSDLSGAVNVKRHQCKVCGRFLGSGHALGGHMRLHYVRKCNLPQGVAADCPNSATMEEQMQKLGLNSPIFYRRRPHSHGSEI